MDNSLAVLSESLSLKIEVLKSIQEYNERQKEAFSIDEPDIDSFDEAIEEKGRLIERLEELDNGFEILYENISTLLRQDRTKYALQIREIQDKISVVTEMSMSIQAQEARNKKLIEEYFARERNSIKNSRVGSKAAFDYYKNMTGMNVPGHSILDSKQ